jgi:RHS repeat-associated protein
LTIPASEDIDFNYTDYDKIGNRLSMKLGDANTQIYGYDNLYQLTAVDYNDGNSTAYDFDKLGNRRTVVNGGTTAYTSNALNQYETVSGTSFTYDKNGNLTFDGAYRYYYDCENRLTDVNSATNEAIVSYKYDYRGRRVARTAGTTTVTYLYDGDQIITDYNGTGSAATNVRKRYYYGMGIDRPICSDNYTGSYASLIFYYYDGLGNVAALSKYDGTVLEKYTYDVYGKPTILSPSDEPRATSAYDNRYLFTGREFDPCVGLYYYRARYYSPNLGRFMEADPIHYADGLNLYIYVKNNPVMFIDSFGLRCPCGETITQIDAVGGRNAWRANGLRHEAEDVAAATGLPDPHNGLQDAFRHCYWSCRMSQELGPTVAGRIGDVHEECGGGPAIEDAMDSFNNAYGRALGVPGSDCRTGCLTALSMLHLWVIISPLPLTGVP